MNDADIMANAYALYAQNLASYGEKSGIIDQLQSLLKSNGAAAAAAVTKMVPTSTASSSDNSQGMDTNNDRDDGMRPACRFCGKTFAQASYIKAHERLHTGEKPYICSVCNKAFSDASNWKKHERMHSRQVTPAMDEGVVPMVTSTPTTPEPMTPGSPSLTMAQISSMSAAGLNLSTQMSQISSFSAQLAQMTPTSSSNSTASIANFFPEVSSVPSSTSQPLSLQNIHMSNSQNSDDAADLSPPMKRNKEDTLNCNLCGKMFSTPASLSMHKKIHSGEKPHICSTCGKAFTQIGTLRAHERVHTGEKPYECTFCGKTFAQCGSFRMHERRHHRDLVDSYQKCFICAATFSSLEELQKHMMCHPGALNLNLQNLQNLHPSALGFPGPMPMGFGLPREMDGKSGEIACKSESSEMSEIEKAFSLYSGQPKSAPAVSLAEHFQLPPFAASTAHAIIQRSLSQGSDPGGAVSMFLATNGAESMNLLNQAYSSSGILSPARLSASHPERSPPPSHDQHKVEEVEPVSTTTRSRKYSSDSHTSLSLPDGPSENALSQSETSKGENAMENGENDTEGATTHSQKTPSEDSSLAESRSTEDFQSDDQHCSSGGGAISRRNLNARMISSSSNSRKQRKPTRRPMSIGGLLDQMPYEPQFNEDGEEIIDEEKITKDQMMVSFLLSKGEVYKCEHCHIIFEDCTLYLLHNGFHANDTDPFKCVICRKSCDGRVEFNCHLTSHIK